MDDLKLTVAFIRYYFNETFLFFMITILLSFILAEETNVTFNETWPLVFMFESILGIMYIHFVNAENLFKYWSIYLPIFVAVILNVYTEIHSVLLVVTAIFITISINLLKYKF